MPSPLEQLLSADELRDVGKDELRKRMLMQMLLQNPVTEDQADPTARDYLGSGNQRPETQIKRYEPGAQDPGMAFSPSGGPHRMAPRDQGVSVGLISTLLNALKGR